MMLDMSSSIEVVASICANRIEKKFSANFTTGSEDKTLQLTALANSKMAFPAAKAD